jgi:hypothetical protein
VGAFCADQFGPNQPPIIRPKFLAGHSPICHPLNGDASGDRYWPIAADPLIYKTRGYTDQFRNGNLSVYGCVVFKFHALNVALLNKYFKQHLIGKVEN